MLETVARRGRLFACGTCMKSRGLGDEELVAGCRRSTLAELGSLTLDARKVLVF
jgi:uncharacterized protein involved in oxidation of intracellular sulfur